MNDKNSVGSIYHSFLLAKLAARAPVIGKIPPKPFSCHKCSRTFNSKYNVVRHLKQYHAEKRMFKCGVCGRDYKWVDSLHKHMKIHKLKSIVNDSVASENASDSGLGVSECLIEDLDCQDYDLNDEELIDDENEVLISKEDTEMNDSKEDDSNSLIILPSILNITDVLPS